MDRNTGYLLDEKNHILQSITDILTTQIGSRVMRRDYGSMLAEFIDSPNTASTHLQIISSVVMALSQFEPRINIIQANLEASQNNLTLHLTFTLKNSSDNQELALITIK